MQYLHPFSVVSSQLQWTNLKQVAVLYKNDRPITIRLDRIHGDCNQYRYFFLNDFNGYEEAWSPVSFCILYYNSSLCSPCLLAQREGRDTSAYHPLSGLIPQTLPLRFGQLLPHFKSLAYTVTSTQTVDRSARTKMSASSLTDSPTEMCFSMIIPSNSARTSYRVRLLSVLS